MDWTSGKAESCAMEAGRSHVHREYARVFQALATNGIAFCLVRPAEKLTALEKDLDLLVDPGRQKEALAALREIGFEILRTEFHNPRKIVMGRWTKTGFVLLDIHFALVCQGFEYLQTDAALARRIAINGIPQLGPADMAVVLVFHDLLGKDHLQPKHRPHIEQMLPSLAGSATERDLVRLGIAKYMPQTVEQIAPLYADPSAALRLARSIRRKLLWGHPRILARRLLMRGKLLVSQPTKGVSICFLGPDGSGKSTAIEEFSRLVREELNWGHSVHYMGPWGHHHFPRFMHFASEPVPERFSDMVSERRRLCDQLHGRESPSIFRALSYEWRRRRGPLTVEEEELRQFQRGTVWSWIAFRFVRAHLRYWFYLVALSIELWWRYAKVWRAKRHGHLVIMDRYIYDFMSGAMHGIRSGYRAIRSLMCALYPRPDRIFLLHADPEIIAARKPDLDLETLKKMQALYASMSDRWNMISISTEVPQDEVVRGIVDRDFDWLVEKRRV